VIAQLVQRWATDWTIGVLGFDSRWGLGIFLFTTASRTILRPTQPPIQWVLGTLFLGVKRPGRTADHSHPSSAEVKEWVELYLHSPNTSSWHGAQLKEAQGQSYFYLYANVKFFRGFLSLSRRMRGRCLKNRPWLSFHIPSYSSSSITLPSEDT
jgi:hypothetical protein